MTLILKQIYTFLKLLNSETGTNQIAAGFACGLILGFSPALSLQTFFIILLIFFFRIQIGAATLSACFFKLLVLLIDPVASSLGSVVLEQESLKPLFTTLYNMPIIPLTRFNNSVVMGSGVLAFALAPVVFVVSKILIVKYRQVVLEKFVNSKVWKVIRATSFYQWYQKYEQLFG